MPQSHLPHLHRLGTICSIAAVVIAVVVVAITVIIASSAGWRGSPEHVPWFSNDCRKLRSRLHAACLLAFVGLSSLWLASVQAKAFQGMLSFELSEANTIMQKGTAPQPFFGILSFQAPKPRLLSGSLGHRAGTFTYQMYTHEPRAPWHDVSL